MAGEPLMKPWPSYRSMAGRWTDDHIAATLNRMGMRTGQGNTWTATSGPASLARKRGIDGYLSAEQARRLAHHVRGR